MRIFSSVELFLTRFRLLNNLFENMLNFIKVIFILVGLADFSISNEMDMAVNVPSCP